MNSSAACIGVVLPYFQREAGLLARALASVFEQKGAGEILAVVVDDASPRPARDEVAALPGRDAERVQLHVQPNAGPAAARNRGLDELPQEVDLVAFLDSDDHWSPDHLARARRMLEADHDLYLSNWMPLESEVDAYRHFQKLDLADHQAVAGESELWHYRGEFFRQELTRPIGRLSTMVFRRERFGDLRFDTRLRTAFEDRLFRLEMARRDPRIVFSTRPECYSGEGVNLFSGKPWGSPGRLEVARDELHAMKIVRKEFELSDPELRLVETIEKGERQDAFTTLMRLWLRERRPEFGRLGRLLGVDPLFLLRWPVLAARARAGKRRPGVLPDSR